MHEAESSTSTGSGAGRAGVTRPRLRGHGAVAGLHPPGRGRPVGRARWPPAGSRATTHPPNPAPVIRAPKTPGSGDQLRHQLVELGRGDLEVVGQAAMALDHKRSGGGQVVDGNASANPHPSALGDHVTGPGPQRRVHEPGQIGVVGRPERSDDGCCCLALGHPGCVERRGQVRRRPEWTTTTSRSSGRSTWRRWTEPKSMSRAWPRRPAAATRGSMAPTGAPVRCSACWHRRARTDADPVTPSTSARATHRAALDESPEPMGSVDSMVRSPPSRGEPAPPSPR